MRKLDTDAPAGGKSAPLTVDDTLCLPFTGPVGGAVEWRLSEGVVGYRDAVEWMERRAAEIAAGAAPECVWLLEHPPLYTAGTSADPADLVDPGRFEVFGTGRGGQYTYHGPGQRIAYVMVDLGRRRRDVRCFVHALEAWLIAALGHFSVKGERRAGRVGIWVDRHGTGRPGREDKIAAIGVRLRKWVSFHGVSVNVDPDLEHFSGIVPCGVTDHGVTSLVDLGHPVTLADMDAALMAGWPGIFGDAGQDGQ